MIDEDLINEMAEMPLPEGLDDLPELEEPYTTSTDALEHQVNFMQIFLTAQTPVKQAVEELGKRGEDALYTELTQLAVTKEVFEPVYIANVPKKANGKPDAITARSVFREKNDETVKARTVGGGHLQDRNIYDIMDELSSPTVMHESINLCLKIACALHLHVITIDIVGAYLNAEMNRDVYMKFGPMKLPFYAKFALNIVSMYIMNVYMLSC